MGEIAIIAGAVLLAGLAIPPLSQWRRSRPASLGHARIRRARER